MLMENGFYFALSGRKSVFSIFTQGVAAGLDYKWFSTIRAVGLGYKWFSTIRYNIFAVKKITITFALSDYCFNFAVLKNSQP